MTSSIAYDVFGNDSTITYPGGFKIRKFYENGYLREIKNDNNNRIWRLDSLSSFSSPRKYLLGVGSLTTAFRYNANGFLTKKITGSREQTFTFDTQTGNLMSRGFKQGAINLTETFTYDNLERLTSSTITGRSPVNITYASNGNILSKTGVGSYYYNINKINAVDSIINNPGSIPTTIQEIEYTSFNKVSEITDSLNNNSIGLEIIYSPDQQRIINTFRQNGAIVRTKYYSIDYEKDSTSTAVKQIYYINCPFGLVAINIRQNGHDSLYFTDTDHLGSILALLRNTGSEAEKFSYDAWGRRRNATDWTYDNIPASTLIDRGYTGHEHYDLFGLIDMNGRVYDPVMGRFLSPDPIIQSPDFTQNYNSYSYCFNNPLKYTDPDGYNANDDNDDFGEYVHTLCYGENSRIDKWLKERFGAQYYDVYFGSQDVARQKVVPIELVDIDGKRILFLIPIQNPNNSNVKIVRHKYTTSDDGHSYVGANCELGIKGKCYTEYNWVQTVSRNGGAQKPDPLGLYMDSWDIKYYKEKYPAYDGFFIDEPRQYGTSMSYELTLIGSKNGKWETVTYLKWGFTIDENGRPILIPISSILIPSQEHLENLYNTLFELNN